MKRIVQKARKCLDQLLKAQRSASTTTRSVIQPNLYTTYQSILHCTKQNSSDEALLRNIYTQITQINNALVQDGVEGCPTALIEVLKEMIDRHFPPPVIQREKAKPTIRLAQKS